MKPSETLSRRLRDASAERISRRTGIPGRTIRGYRNGHIPSVDIADTICRALALHLRLGPEESPIPDDLVPTSDSRLAVMVAALADEWEALNEHGRQRLEIRYWVHFEELRNRATANKGPRLARLAERTVRELTTEKGLCEKR